MTHESVNSWRELDSLILFPDKKSLNVEISSSDDFPPRVHFKSFLRAVLNALTFD